jgi:hypothetical protein
MPSTLHGLIDARSRNASSATASVSWKTAPSYTFDGG